MYETKTKPSDHSEGFVILSLFNLMYFFALRPKFSNKIFARHVAKLPEDIRRNQGQKEKTCSKPLKNL